MDHDAAHLIAMVLAIVKAAFTGPGKCRSTARPTAVLHSFRSLPRCRPMARSHRYRSPGVSRGSGWASFATFLRSGAVLRGSARRFSGMRLRSPS